MRKTANFAVKIYRHRLIFLVLTDLNEPGYPSVTNDIENVLAVLVEGGSFKPGMHVIYFDSDGSWDEVVIDGLCRFVTFYLMQEASRERAMTRVMVVAGG